MSLKRPWTGVTCFIKRLSYFEDRTVGGCSIRPEYSDTQAVRGSESHHDPFTDHSCSRSSCGLCGTLALARRPIKPGLLSLLPLGRRSTTDQQQDQQLYVNKLRGTEQDRE